MLIVGAPGDDIVSDANGNVTGSVTDRGAAYVFAAADNWAYVRRLEPVLPAGDNGEGAQFGSSVALDHGFVVGRRASATATGGLQTRAPFGRAISPRLHPATVV